MIVILKGDLVRTLVFLCYAINETNSKAEQGNDNIIACDSNDDFTATEHILTICRPYTTRDAAAIAAAAAAAVRDTRG